MISYRALQKKAKELGIKASGSYVALAARILEAENHEVISHEHAAHAPQKAVPKAKVEPTNKRGKTVAQVKKDNEAAAGMIAAGRF